MSVYEITDGIVHVDGRIVPAYKVFHSTFSATDWHVRGFHLRTENGLTISTVWSTATYSDNHDHIIGQPGTPFHERSQTAELCAWWDPDHKLTWPGGDTVIGWIEAPDWWELITRLSELPTNTPHLLSRWLDA